MFGIFFKSESRETENKIYVELANISILRVNISVLLQKVLVTKGVQFIFRSVFKDIWFILFRTTYFHELFTDFLN